MLHSTIKFILFVFNLIFVITGIALISIGLAIKTVYVEYSSVLDEDYLQSSTLLISVGVIIFAIAFFGCAGAYKENQCMLLTYSVLLGAIFVMEIVAGVTGYVLSDKADDVLRESLNNTLEHYQNDTAIKNFWDKMQSDLHCCGVTNHTDWFSVMSISETGIMPNSCCPKTTSEGNHCVESSGTYYHQPCLSVLVEIIQDNAITTGGAALGIAFIQLLGIVLACYLSKSIKASNYETV